MIAIDRSELYCLSWTLQLVVTKVFDDVSDVVTSLAK